MKNYVIKFKEDTYLYYLTFVNYVGEQKTVMTYVETRKKEMAMVFCRKTLAEAIAKSLRGKVEML